MTKYDEVETIVSTLLLFAKNLFHLAVDLRLYYRQEESLETFRGKVQEARIPRNFFTTRFSTSILLLLQ